MTTPCVSSITLDELKDPKDFFQTKVFMFLSDEQKQILQSFTSPEIKVSHDGNGNITFLDESKQLNFTINIEQIVKNKGCNPVATSFFNTLFTDCPRITDKINIQCGALLVQQINHWKSVGGREANAKPEKPRNPRSNKRKDARLVPRIKRNKSKII